MMAPALATAFGFNGSPPMSLLSIRKSAPGNHNDVEEEDGDSDYHEVHCEAAHHQRKVDFGPKTMLHLICDISKLCQK